MDISKNELILITVNVLITLVLLLIAYLFKKNNPKEINNFVGYRTKRSMSSKENWLKGNKYSSNLLFKLSLVLLPVQVLLYLLFNPLVVLLILAGLWILIALITIFKTEIQLKNTDTNYK